MSTLRKPTNPNGAHGTGTPFNDAAGARHCMKCNKWRPQAGGAKNKRTGFWNCAGCLGKVFPCVPATN